MKSTFPPTLKAAKLHWFPSTSWQQWRPLSFIDFKKPLTRCLITSEDFFFFFFTFKVMCRMFFCPLSFYFMTQPWKYSVDEKSSVKIHFERKQVLCELLYWRSPGQGRRGIIEQCCHITVRSGMRRHFGVEVWLPISLASCCLSLGADCGLFLSLNLRVGHAVTAVFASWGTTGSFTCLSMLLDYTLDSIPGSLGEAQLALNVQWLWNAARQHSVQHLSLH